MYTVYMSKTKKNAIDKTAIIVSEQKIPLHCINNANANKSFVMKSI